MGRVAGKVAIITGAARGLGRASAMVLAREGAAVILTDLRTELGEATAEAIRRGEGDARFLRHDVSREDEWKHVLEATLARYGRLDVLVNNAGVGIVGNCENQTLEKWHALMRVNLDGVFLGTKHAMPAMRRGGGGSIINLSSIEGIVGSADQVAYCTSKGGVRNFTKAAALHGAPFGVRVNSIHPGYIRTEMVEEYFVDHGDDVEEAIAAVGKLHPLRRVGRPEDIAYGVLYLASDDSSFMTGSELVIDGGFLAQ